MRRLLILASAIIFFDVAFYAAISPLLPKYVEDLSLSEAQAGLLTASYALGTLLNALPAGFVVSRIGPRHAVMAGLGLLTVATVAFGIGGSFGVLVAARFAQGVSGALTWTGSLTWLVSSAPDNRRGAVIGTALGTGVAGAMLGPPLGALASGVGTTPVFAGVAVITLSLIFAAARLPDSVERASGSIGETLRTMARRPVLAAIGTVAVPSLMFGAVAVIVPLRIDDLGGGAALIAAGFTIGAGLEAILSPLVGRYTDRRGRSRPYVSGLCISLVAVLAIPSVGTAALVSAATVLVALGAAFCFTPATAALSVAVEAEGLHQGFGSALMNMAWALGIVIGNAAAGAATEAFGFAAPCIALAALMATTAILVSRLYGDDRVEKLGGRPGVQPGAD